MDQLLEFAGNHLLLVALLVVITVMIIRTEMERLFSGIMQLNPFEAIREINDKQAVLLDVRESKEFNEGHIQDAIHIPLGDVKNRLSELEKYKNKSIIAYCRSGSRSYNACKTLKKAGFEQIRNLKGGIMSWQNQNMPVTNR